MATLLLALGLAQAACDDVDATLAQARSALLAADFETASTLRARAEDNLTCGPPRSASVLAELWLVEGVLAGVNGDVDSATLAFAAARRADESVWDDVFGDQLAQLWQQADDPESRGTVELDPALELPWEVWVDGAAAELPATLPAGLHAVQVHHDGVVHLGQMLRIPTDETVRITHPLPADPRGLPDPQPRAGARVSLAVGVGVQAAAGQILDEADVGREPAGKVMVPIELGLQAESPELWVRGSASVGPALTGPFLYARDEAAASSPVAVGGHVAGGPQVGRTRLGVLAGIQWPGRIPLRAVVALPLGELPLRLEGRAGVNLTTERPVEPSGGIVLSYVPWL